jgi:hypothetical protein
MKRVVSVCSLVAAAVVCGACRESTGPSSRDFFGCVRVSGTFDPAAPGFIVEYRNGVDAVATTKQLEAKYFFSAKFVYTTLPGFAAQLNTSALAGVRCESTVAAISHDGVARLALR